MSITNPRPDFSLPELTFDEGAFQELTRLIATSRFSDTILLNDRNLRSFATRVQIAMLEKLVEGVESGRLSVQQGLKTIEFILPNLSGPYSRQVYSEAIAYLKHYSI